MIKAEIESVKMSLVDHIKSLEGKRIEIDADNLLHLFCACTMALYDGDKITEGQRKTAMAVAGSTIDLLANEPQKAKELIEVDKKAMAEAEELHNILEKDPKKALEMLLKSLVK